MVKRLDGTCMTGSLVLTRHEYVRRSCPQREEESRAKSFMPLLTRRIWAVVLGLSQAGQEEKKRRCSTEAKQDDTGVWSSA